MIFKDIVPIAPLRAVVEQYRLRHFVIPQDIPAVPKPFPCRPEQCMAFYPRGYEQTYLYSQKVRVDQPRSVLSGQFTSRIDRLSGTHEFLMIQVVFRPGALHKLTGLPFHELLDQHLNLEDLFYREVRLTNERLCNCEGYDEMITIIEQFLLALLRKQKVEARPADEIFHLIAKQPNRYSLPWLASQACLSPRQFERKANQYLGVSPHFFARIARFHQSYELKAQNKTLDWLSVALACGYHDYQHLTRDYQAFASDTPNRLFQADSKSLERSLGLRD
jgi:AraC-like DNA-binding protein